jgi:GntR family transcriptional regulator
METDNIRVRDTSASLYEQVRRDLLERIYGNEFKPGDLLPTEEALCREYDVSRITVRRAVDEASPFETTEFVNKVEPARPDVAAALHIEPGVPVRHRRTTSNRNGEPFTLTDHYTPETLTENGAVPGTRTEGARLGPRVARAEQELAATKASALVAKHLGIDAGRPIMYASRVFLSSDDKPVRFTISSYHPDRYRFTVDLRPGHDNLMFEAPPDPN